MSRFPGSLSRIAAPALALSALLACPAVAHAVHSNFVRDTPGGPIVVATHTIPAGVAATFETFNLTANSNTIDVPDTVMHLFDNPGGQFAGSDDCGSEVRSCVVVGATANARSIKVYIRAYNNRRWGVASYRANIGGTITTATFSFGGTILADTAALATNAWVETVQQNRGFANPAVASTDDTILMVLNGTPTGAIGLSDDEGNLKMSRLRTSAPCSFCQIVVGNYASITTPFVTNGVSTVVWSDDPADSDLDGLPNNLETAVLGTRSDLKDTDTDGLDDGVEVLGLDNLTLRYPYFGADPKITDLFVEVDHVTGTAWTGAQGEEFVRGFRVNGFKKPGGVLVTLNALNQAPMVDARDIRAHIDIGLANTATDDSRFAWGNWGGSGTIPNNNHCNGFTGTVRDSSNHWHHIASPGGNAGFGKCAQGGPGLASGVHETGHMLGLEHGGWPNTGPNGNVVYGGIMNYNFQQVNEDPAFSLKRWPNVLNVSSVSEDNWGPTGTNLSAYIHASFTSTRYAGPLFKNQIDFNGDNAFASAAQRGMGTFSRQTASANPMPWNSFGLNFNTELAWLPGASNRLYLFHHYTKGATSRIEYRYSTDVTNCNNKQSDWGSPCNSFIGYTTLSATAGAKGIFGVERILVNGVWKLLLVFIDASDKLRYMTIDATSASAVADVPMGAKGTASSITGPGLVRLNNSKVLMVAGVGGTLFGWELDASTGTFNWSVQKETQKYADGTNVAVSASAMTMTHGYLADLGAGVQIVGALADGNLIKIARYNTSTRRWVLLSDLNASANGGGGFWTDNKIGFAYVPYTTASRTPGRFVLSYTRPGSQGWVPFMVKTIGNDPNPAVDPVTNFRPRLLKWRGTTGEEFVYDEYFFMVSAGLDLLYDMDVDTHLRASHVSGSWADTDNSQINSVVLLPMADGHQNYDLRDYNDWTVMRSNLACSLQGCGRQ